MRQLRQGCSAALAQLMISLATDKTACDVWAAVGRYDKARLAYWRKPSPRSRARLLRRRASYWRALSRLEPKSLNEVAPLNEVKP